MKKCSKCKFFKCKKDGRYPGLCWSCICSIKYNILIKACEEQIALNNNKGMKP